MTPTPSPSSSGGFRRTPALEALAADVASKAATPSFQMLQALGRTGKHVYAGTVPAATVARRRAASRRARAARRAARLAA